MVGWQDFLALFNSYWLELLSGAAVYEFYKAILPQSVTVADDSHESCLDVANLVIVTWTAYSALAMSFFRFLCSKRYQN